MIQIINLRTLFEKLLPELSLRISHSHLSTWRGKLQIATRTERITLLIDRGDISLASAGDHADAEHAIDGGEEIALLVMGTESADSSHPLPVLH